MFENTGGFRFSDAAVVQGVHCSPGKMHWIIHSREKWQTRDISQSLFPFRRSRNAKSLIEFARSTLRAAPRKNKTLNIFAAPRCVYVE